MFGSITLAFIFKEYTFQGDGHPGIAAVEQPRMPPGTFFRGNLEMTRQGPGRFVLMTSSFLVAQPGMEATLQKDRIIPVTTRRG